MLYERNRLWERSPLAEWLSFSSFSLAGDQTWAWRAKRPFQIALLPGYAPPPGLDRTCKDALWVEGAIEKPLVVWDGYSPVALFEVILECFDPLGESAHIAVVDRASGLRLRDGRDPDVLRVRPRRVHGMTSREIQNHVFELSFWSGLAGPDTKVIYDNLRNGGFKNFAPNSDLAMSETLYDQHRADKRDMRFEWSEATSRLKSHPLCRGRLEDTPSGGRDTVPLLDMRENTLMRAKRRLEKSDLVRLDEVGGSFHALSILLGAEQHASRRERKRGMEERFDRSASARPGAD